MGDYISVEYGDPSAGPTPEMERVAFRHAVRLIEARMPTGGFGSMVFSDAVNDALQGRTTEELVTLLSAMAALAHTALLMVEREGGKPPSEMVALMREAMDAKFAAEDEAT